MIRTQTIDTDFCDTLLYYLTLLYILETCGGRKQTSSVIYCCYYIYIYMIENYIKTIVFRLLHER